MRNLILIVITALTLTSCSYTTFSNIYDVGLDNVERPSETSERYGEYTVSTMEESGVEKYTYSDDLMEMIFWVGNSQVNFLMKNKSDHSIKIIWDESAFIFDGISSGVMHKGIKYSEKDASQRPSVVAKNSSLSDVIVPTSYVSYAGGYVGWVEAPFLLQGNSEAQLKANGIKTVGKTIQVLLPLSVEGVVNEYTFTFKVNDVESKIEIVNY